MPRSTSSTYRDVEVDRRHPLSITLADLSRGHGTQRIALHGLTTADIARLVALSTGSEPDAALVEAVQRETEGNPFFVSEVVRLLVAEGQLGKSHRPTSWSVSIPESVRDVVGLRLERLSETCNDVLSVASVVGREFSLPVLARVNGSPMDDLLDALEEAVRARLVREEATAQRYRFTHALVQDTLYADLSAARRLRLHAAVGRALEQFHAADLAPHYGELAYHFAIAAPAGHASQAVDYAIKAGDRSMAQFAWEPAAQHYERALQALDLQTSPSAVQRCDILLALGAAQFYAVLDVSDSPGGQASYLRAAEIAQTLGSFERLGRAALGFAGINVARTAGGLQQVRLLEAALALAPTGDSALKARLMARLAVDYRVLPEMAERIEPLSAEALAMARRLGDPAVLAPVLIARHSAAWGVDTLDERLAVTAEAQRMAAASGDVVSLLWAYLFNSIAMYEAGDSQATARVSDAFDEQARQSGMPYFHWVAAVWQVGRALREGNFPKVEALLPTLGGDSQALVAVYFRALFSFLLYRDQGRLAESDALLRAVIDLARQTAGSFDQHRGHIAHLLRLLLLAETGRADEASTLLAAFADGDIASLPHDAYWLATIALLGEVSVVVHDRDRVTLLYELLLPYASRNVAPASSFVSFGAAAYYLARMAVVLGRRDAAVQHFEAALTLNAQMRARPAVVWTQVAYADLLIQRAASGDWERARALLNEAHATSRELGMVVRAEQAEALLAMLGSLVTRPARPTAALPYDLSPREIEVLGLLVAGHTDREIGEALFISHRTVTTHVSNIFSKLNVNSRTEAAALAVRQGLV